MTKPSSSASNPSHIATRFTLTGKVQGVGFRPFVYRLAKQLGIRGWVQNLKGRVLVHAEASAGQLEAFARSLIEQAPTIAQPEISHQEAHELESMTEFVIRDSDQYAEADIHIPPDFFTCPDCLREMDDPQDRRYGYPFINCTQCGPRYTLIRTLPYDRPNTSMADFPLCPDCMAEYEDPMNRRFHAEPVACPVCGPTLSYVAADQSVEGNESAMEAAVEALRIGRILAIKGVGGYHLVCDARNDEAVQRLRLRKQRPDKPLAVLVPARGEDELDAVRAIANITPAEAECLRAPSRPIVLVTRRDDANLAAGIAPGLNQIGVFLPYSPLHHRLLQLFDGPLVATSANISGEPVLTDNQDVDRRLAQVTDGTLHHNREIVRPADDSVFRVIAGNPRPLRLGRGFAPVEHTLPFRLKHPLLAVGGQMKNTVALAWEDRIVISPHIGDLDSPRSLTVFENTINDLQELYQVKYNAIVADAHPAYAAHRWANKTGAPVIPVYHHLAHASALGLEYPADEPWLVFTWDGVGYGTDGHLWGGEALYGSPGNWQRVASFRPFSIPGGDRAGREPWRSAAALCWEAGLPYSAPADQELMQAAWENRINCPTTTAVGRLFDAAAALTGLVDKARFEGQGPMMLETRATVACDAESLPLQENKQGLVVADWAPLLPMLSDASIPLEDRASRFHATMAATLVQQAKAVRESKGAFRIGLSGGVFQNKRLSEQVFELCARVGLEVYMPAVIPCNDGGLCAGQIIEAAAQNNDMKH